MTEQEHKKNTKKRPKKKGNKSKGVGKAPVVLGGVIVIVVLVIVVIFSLFGNVGPMSDTSLLSFNSDGSVVYEEIEPLDDESYNSGEIKAFAKGEIASYNNNNEGNIKLEKFKMVDDTNAYLRLKYDSFETYLDFTGYEGFIGTVAEARNRGYNLDVPFVSIGGEDATDATEDSTNSIFVIRENTSIKLDGEILYVSKDGTTINEDGSILIESVGGDHDSAGLTYIIYK